MDFSQHSYWREKYFNQDKIRINQLIEERKDMNFRYYTKGVVLEVKGKKDGQYIGLCYVYIVDYGTRDLKKYYYNITTSYKLALEKYDEYKKCIMAEKNEIKKLIL